MWNNSSLCCLLALAILCLRSLIYSQEIGSLGHPWNFKCVTHNLRKMICTWDVSLKGRHGQTDFCYTTNDLPPPVCFKTKEKRVEIPVPESSSTVTITTNSISGTAFATKEFEIHKKDISFVPFTPHILSLTPDFSTSTLNLKWSDSGSVFPYGLDAFWQIQILRKEAMEKVIQVTYYSKLTHEDIILSWNWTSDMPLECTSHYVKIRCYINVTQFVGPKDWSDWSPVEEVPGKDTEPNGSGVFPQDTVVAVGSDVTICCVHEEGQQIQRMTYGPEVYPMIHLSSRSSAIRVLNASASDTSGTNVVCILSEDEMDGTVLFVGYAPDTPQNLSCETFNFLIIKCTWKPGRPSGLYGKRRTKYSLFERISGKNVSCEVNEMNRERVCGFPVLADQNTYDFILGVSNPIGQTESSLMVDLTQRVHPKTPEKLTVSGNSSTSVRLRWFINGSFAEIRLLCQIEISSGHYERKLHNVSMPGGKFSIYTAQLNALHPYTKYQFRVRCSSADHFWRWSDWSRIEEHTTLEAPPARGPDIWRERSPSGRSLKIFWKPLSLSEANGKILSHEVSCYLLETPLEYKEVTEPSNSTEIKLGKNDCVVSVVAKNHAGSSPPSRITSVELPSNNVKTDRAIAMGNGIYISWNSYPNMTCGYIVKWCHSSGSEPCSVDWQKFPSNTTDAVIKSALFRPGVRYSFSLYGCKSSGYQLLKNITGYMKELPPKRAPNFTVEETSSDSILVKWEDIPIEDCQGFLEGYRLSFAKGEKDALKPRLSESGNPELKVKNITDLTKKSLKILDLQGKTSYQLDLQAYTAGGLSPPNSLYVVTKEDSVGLIIAILIPVAVVVLLGVVASIFCYRKREWIKETFYPEIPNPENSKALQFHKNICEGNKTLKTLEMNPCTPNSVEVVETQSAAPKIGDTEMMSLAADATVPEDGSDSEVENHVVVSYCPPIIEEEISNAPMDEPVGSSQVVYIDIQSMYQPQINKEEEPEIDLVTTAGYKPQMQLPISALKIESCSPAEEELDKIAGYRPQANTNVWNMDTPDSPGSVESNNENASFGSPCSINSRQFLLPPKDDEDSPKPSNIAWSFTHFFQNKPND
ncbi:leukemia inhibitory factor receptor [Falco biarmicus]|uniref:leukemia inhibitory factor receptor n=1 Tax=Falco peregrinus TaxID=8954 RepID=UPI000392D0B3|nr:leukemia inhibitory factor receptor [Falco peregrinus]XP_027647887.2 leukemia inhibitory factor receptor [Falco peregrinus]XP_027647888.2 leukemia inhibitory factor receptor [Falco peregrinus]XP_027647890.2 leukemia inhibitory factor receptor [Falco peregrinus]XP_027667063.1 leukemia inhibitory factor receptor [Falco cherrug]XP_027667068.1 leukemia inhibitory factor receptor [Falco cherrug]XP_027667074.1 leukemia inhibitory factor receptor [Falco cherrug]XP_027667079.1 leukemia inhibitory